MTLPKETPMIERLADAIDNAEVGYSLRLTSMVDGVSTYTLTMDGYPDEQFEWIDDGYEAIRKRRRAAQARAVLTALREPGMDALNAAVDKTGAGRGMSWSNRSPQSLFREGWQAMIDRTLSDGADHG